MNNDGVNRESTLQRIVGFLRSIGIEVNEGAMSRSTLVPGIDIVRGALLIDEGAMCMPADLLHEAAHIALTKPAVRSSLDGTISSTPADELMAIAWTWAASRHLNIAPEETFHEDVISGNGPTLRENFRTGHYIGVPGLQRWGMTVETKHAAARGVAPYPAMLRWLRTD
jgi:hypothetical protein